MHMFLKKGQWPVLGLPEVEVQRVWLEVVAKHLLGLFPFSFFFGNLVTTIFFEKIILEMLFTVAIFICISKSSRATCFYVQFKIFSENRKLKQKTLPNRTIALYCPDQWHFTELTLPYWIFTTSRNV